MKNLSSTVLLSAFALAIALTSMAQAVSDPIVAPAPEPVTSVLGILGMGALGVALRRRRTK